MSVRRVLPVALALAFWALPAVSQEVIGIAAVVNDRAISVFDLQQRIDVAIYNANLARTDDIRRRVAGTVLRNLVDETLQVEEARDKGVRVTDRDIAEAIARIEDGNGVPRGELEAFLIERGIAVGTVVDQIRSQIAWGKYVNQRIRPTIGVSEEEIDEELARLENNRGRPEFLVSEIVLYDDPAASAAEQGETARSIVAQLRSGADFAAVAAQFSQGPLARNGGDLGWIQEGRSRSEIERVLVAMAVGEISDPIRSVDSWRIVQLRDKRAVMSEPAGAVELFLSQIMLPVGEDETPEAAAGRMALADDIHEQAEDCEALRTRGAELENSLSGDIGWVTLDDLPATFRDVLGKLKVEEASAPLVTDNGVHVLMVCERNERDAEAGIRDTIYERIATRRLAIAERRLLRDLRRRAFVDLRV